MILALSEEELKHIDSWYHSAAWESATDRTAEMYALLDKLGIKADGMDLYLPTPEDLVESHRPVIMAQIEAIKAYLARHPEIDPEDC